MGGRSERAIVMQQKTGRPVQFELLADARASLLAWLERRGGTVDDYVFPSRVDPTGHVSTRQYARLVNEWVTGVALMRSGYGTHSLRRTKASIIYRATGNLRAVQILLGHSKIENTVRYLGIDVEDALALAENTESNRIANHRFPTGADTFVNGHRNGRHPHSGSASATETQVSRTPRHRHV